jgi:hypothetical protein
MVTTEDLHHLLRGTLWLLKDSKLHGALRAQIIQESRNLLVELERTQNPHTQRALVDAYEEWRSEVARIIGGNEHI